MRKNSFLKKIFGFKIANIGKNGKVGGVFSPEPYGVKILSQAILFLEET